MKGGNPTCSGAMLGGKRRSRRMRGGMYGADPNAPPIGAGAMPWSSTDAGLPVNSATGQTMPDPYDLPARGGGRRRKTRKGGKHRRGHRGTRKMKGGGGQNAGMISAGQVGYGYTGSGVGGLADPTRTVQPGNAF